MGSAGRRLRELDDRVLGSFERVMPSWLRALQGSPLLLVSASLGAAWVFAGTFMLVLFVAAGEPYGSEAATVATGAVLLAVAVVVGRRRSRRGGS